jgi:hypothetical protein
MNTESQCKEILHYLSKGETLTVAEAMSKLGVYALSQRCGDLRRQGWPIKCRMITVASGKRIGQYYYDHPVAA